MEHNPYAAPRANGPNVRDNRDDPRSLRAIAGYQRAMIACILMMLALFVPMLAAGSGFAAYFAVALLAAQLSAAVFVMLLAAQLFGTLGGVLLGVLSMTPLVGLLVIFLINGRAIRRLKANGVPIGFLGARISERRPDEE